MKMITEQKFKLLLDVVWIAFSEAASLRDLLESVGLRITEPETPGPSGFASLYNLRDKLSKTLFTVLGIDGNSVLNELDDFLFDVYMEYPEDKTFPEVYYAQLLDILTLYGNEKLPWEEKTGRMQMRDEKCRHHRGLCISNSRPVIGYLIADVEHTYIIPYGNDVFYDKDSLQVKTMGLEVHKETVSIDLLLDDDEGNALFDGDHIKLGENRFILRASNIQLLNRIHSERATKGLHRIKRNYEAVHPVT